MLIPAGWVQRVGALVGEVMVSGTWLVFKGVDAGVPARSGGSGGGVTISGTLLVFRGLTTGGRMGCRNWGAVVARPATCTMIAGGSKLGGGIT